MFIGSKNLPRDVLSMDDFIEGNCIYVDKTDLLAKLLLGFKGPYLLTRPRRFGKTTLVETLKELFENGLEKFHGLKISKYTEEELRINKRYKVLYLSFATYDRDEDDVSLEKRYANDVRGFFDKLNIHINDSFTDLPQVLKAGLSQLDEQIVLLIDEYDGFLTSVFDNEVLFNKRKALIKEFFQVIKAHSTKFRFTFITGIARFSQVSIFSEYNTIFDISVDPEFASIAGYTQDELEHYFAEYIDNAADVLSQMEGRTCKRADVLELLKKHYDGYSFDEMAKCYVYNPWSIINFLYRPQLGFRDYWVQSASAFPSILRKYLEKIIKEDAVSALNLNNLLMVKTLSLSPDFIKGLDTQKELCAILYQAGYYSIKEKSTAPGFVQIGIPNLEVKNCFEDNILSVLIKSKTLEDFIADYNSPVLKNLNEKNLVDLKATLLKMLNELSYESLKHFDEACFRDELRVIFKVIGIEAQSEVYSALGRVDLVLPTEHYLYVIELKVARDGDEIEKKAIEARTQIIDRKYASRLTNKTVVPITLVILNQVKTESHPAKFDVAVLDEVDLVNGSANQSSENCAML